ncbi:hypothetical protein IDSA_01300 [Pseudidiomarina salinarum]|uniref:Methyltransferase type 11 domain-containing protein n=1 Tax=Pseudidiomarina salinarum TaxID=435908 RepID=A0A094JFS0_9GAMM|nr:class I SAM-dependent methyltransferase [Pseudidiomarina salinarum]KFZ31386.1 hypothetical protein IDSA_01300 [Pseudidiomarina salinarum]RUO70854.1 methyltransferase domain-containing protein [Pseudidiomarina salinarum]
MEHWSKYWHTKGVLNSFAEGEANKGYTGVVKKFWDTTFAEIPTGGTVIDAGSGNGALALLAFDYSRANQKDFVIHGVDAARIDPAAQLSKSSPAIAKKLKQITFHSETPVEQMPFVAGSVDAVVSQFAFEYADRNQALKSILESLKEGGTFTAMAHHASSSLLKDSKQGVVILTDILENSPLFQQADLLIDLAAQAIPQLGEKGWSEFSHNRIISRSIQWTMQALQERYNKAEQQMWVNDVVRRVARVMQVMKGDNLAECRKQLAFEYHLLSDHKLRLQDQLNAALAKKDITALKKAAEKSGAKFEADVIEHDGDTFAWTLKIRKK